MKNTTTILILFLVTLFNAGCSGCAKVEKPTQPSAPVVKQFAAPVVEQKSAAPVQEVKTEPAVSENKEGDVFKWANRENAEGKTEN